MIILTGLDNKTFLLLFVKSDFSTLEKTYTKMSLPRVPGEACPGYIFVPRAVALCTFLEQGRRPALGTRGYQPWVQDGNSGLTALGTFLYQRQPALCTFLDQGRSAPGTQGYQPWVQDGN